MSPHGRRRREGDPAWPARLPATLLLGAGLLASLLVALLLFGCSSGDGDELTVAAASSLRPALGDPEEAARR